MANEKMVACKACGAEIAKSAKVCPHCGAKNKQKHPILIGALIVLALVIVIGAASGGGDKKTADPSTPAATNARQEQNEQSEATKPTEKTGFGVGEKAEQKGVSVTLVNVEESKGSRFNKPTDGNVFLLCEFEIENNSDSEITVSSLVSFDAYCDDYAANVSLTALMEKGNKNQLDGTVAAGKKINGVVGYEVPADWKDLEIRYSPSFWFGKEMTFTATH